MTYISRHPKGYSLIEISLVIALVLSLSAIGGISVSAVNEWQKGSAASLSLQAVYSAQRSYLADHPTSSVADISVDQLVPYLPLGWTTIPVVKDLDDTALYLDHQVVPPILRTALGAGRYDPSSNTSDGLWDVGE